MAKKTVSEIKGYYQKQNVAVSYDDRRFAGFGGEYINKQEVGAALHAIQVAHSKKESTRVLDVGAGRGRLSIPLKNEGYEVYCLDASVEMTKFLKGHIKPANIQIQSAFDAYKFSIKFDYITSLRFFDHFDIKDQKKLLKEMVKSLKKTGKIVYLALNKSSLESWGSRFFPYGRYNYFYTDEEYRRLFQRCGMKVVERYDTFFFPRGMFLYAQKIPLLAQILISIDKAATLLVKGKGALVTYTLEKKS